MNTQTLGQRLRQARERKKMTQQQLGDIIGIARESIHGIEDGSTKNPRCIEKLAKVLEVSPGWLRFGDEKIDALDVESLEVAEMFNGLSPELRKAAFAAIKALKASS